MAGEISPKKDLESEKFQEGPLIEVGQWYWTVEEDKQNRLACVTKLGSNFAEFWTPYESSFRVHFNEFEKICKREMNPEAVIRGQAERYQKIVQDKLKEINDIVARLGVGENHKIERRPEEEASRSLAVLSGTDNVKSYKKSLIKAKEKDLPKLFEDVKNASYNLTAWMKAQTLPLKGMIDEMEGCIERIEDRIFNVSLYAGLTEEVELIAKGAPASAGEKLKILQRMCFMDEECLANYQHGGMEFDGIGEFDAWLTRPENRDRILPFPRCMVAFRVRRNRKNRGPALDLATAFLHFELEKLDETTFLYIRNGERVYRMGCDLEFGELIFPSRDEFHIGEPMMAKIFCSQVKELITKRHYDDLLKEARAELEEKRRLSEEWKIQNKGKKDIHNPHSYWHLESHIRNLQDDYEPFSPESVYYDEAKGEIERRVKHYNRIALIVQGLYDRSEVLHPHPPFRLWDPGGFEAGVELVYADHGLYHGDPPDFQAYFDACGASLGEGSVTIGQQEFFERKMAQKENGRWNSRGSYTHERYCPMGNPGPGYVAKIGRWLPRVRQAVFHWTRERQTSDYWGGKKYGDPIPTSIAVPAASLFNVSAYKPGDFKKFYQDPRTRAQYLQWANLLISAEEFHAGNLTLEDGGRFGKLKEKRKGRKVK